MTALLGAAVLLYAAGLFFLWQAQERLLFQPAPLPPAHSHAVDGDVHEVWIDVPGARLNALHLRLPSPDGVVFFLHGNAGNLSGWFVDPAFYRRANFDLFMIDYRGYGKSSGRIENQAQLQADVRAAWDAAAPRYRGKTHVVYGRSLGSGLAALLAADVQPSLTVLVSPYSSLAALAAELHPVVPAWALERLLRYPLRTDAALPKVRGRVLIVHGREDRLIAPEHSIRLKRLLPGAEVLLVPQAGHNDIQSFAAYREALAAALSRR